MSAIDFAKAKTELRGPHTRRRVICQATHTDSEFKSFDKTMFNPLSVTGNYTLGICLRHWTSVLMSKLAIYQAGSDSNHAPSITHSVAERDRTHRCSDIFLRRQCQHQRPRARVRAVLDFWFRIGQGLGLRLYG